MNKYLVLFIGMAGLGCYGLGLCSMYAMHQVSYQQGWLHSSVCWTKDVEEIEAALKNDGKAVVGPYRLVVDKKHKVVKVRVK